MPSAGDPDPPQAARLTAIAPTSAIAKNFLFMFILLNISFTVSFILFSGSSPQVP
jgi:hypothetical protein